MPANRTLLRGGTIVPVDPAFPAEFAGDLLIEDGAIASVAPQIDVDPAGTEILDMTGHIVLPGFADTHRHMWQSVVRYAGVDWVLKDYANAMWRTLGPAMRPEDTYLSLRLGLAEALDAGVTQVFDWNHNVNSPEHADATVAAHRDSGARVVFGYGQSSPVWAEILDPEIGTSKTAPDQDIRRVAAQYYSSKDQLLTLALAARGPECSPMDVVAEEAQLAKELALRSCIHVGNGTWGKLEPVRQMHELGLADESVTWVHGNSLPDSEFDLIQGTGGAMSCAPELEAHMGHGSPSIERCLIRGIRPSLSVDTCVNVSGDLFSIMRAALANVRGDVHARNLQEGTDSESVPVTALDVLEFGTLAGAKANGLGDRTGSLTPGKDADVVTINTVAPNLMPMTYAAGSVLMAHPGNVDTVFVRGKAVKRDGMLVGIDLRDLASKATATRDELFARAGATTGGWMPSRTNAKW